eukprot:bmy_17619T0
MYQLVRRSSDKREKHWLLPSSSSTLSLLDSSSGLYERMFVAARIFLIYIQK